MTTPSSDLKWTYLHQYIYLAETVKVVGRSQERLENSQVLGKLWDAVKQWYTRYGLEPAAPFPPPLPPSNQRDQWHCFYPGQGDENWQPAKDRPFEVRFRALWTGDTLCLQFGIRTRQTADGSTWQALTRYLGAPKTELGKSDLLLRQLKCFRGWVHDGATPSDTARIVFSVGNGQPRIVRQVLLPDRGWLFDCPGLADTYALLSTDSHNTKADSFCDRLLPELDLYSAKIDYEHDVLYRGRLRRRLVQADENLARVLHCPQEQPDKQPSSAKERKKRLDSLQQQIDSVVKEYGTFAAQLSAFRPIQHAIGINAGNLERDLAALAFPIDGPIAALQRDITGKRMQLDVDDKFYDIRVHEAEMALRSLQGQAEILRAWFDEDRNEKLGENVEHIGRAQRFLHVIEYFLVSIYFAEVAHLLFIHPHAPENGGEHGAPESIDWLVRKVLGLGAVDWIECKVVGLGAVFGFVVAALVNLILHIWGKKHNAESGKQDG